MLTRPQKTPRTITRLPERFAMPNSALYGGRSSMPSRSPLTMMAAKSSFFPP